MTLFAWIFFLLLVIALLALDLGVFNKINHEISTSEALKMTLLWIVCALIFAGVLVVAYQHDWFELLSSTSDSSIHNGYDAGLKYITGYLIEKSLSLDNIFVMAMTTFIKSSIFFNNQTKMNTNHRGNKTNDY